MPAHQHFPTSFFAFFSRLVSGGAEEKQAKQSQNEIPEEENSSRSSLISLEKQQLQYRADQLLTRFELALKDQSCSNATIRNYRSDINQFIEFSGNPYIHQLIDKPQLQAFLEYQLEKGLKISSVTRKLASITQLALWAKKEGFITYSLDWLENTSVERILNPDLEIVTAPEIQPPQPGLLQRLPNVSQAFLPYLNLALIVLFFLGLGFFGYSQFKTQAPLKLAYPSQPTSPARTLSFQGRLTDASQTPITTATNMRFYIYDAASGGNLEWDSNTCSLDPDADGIFNAALGAGAGTGSDSDNGSGVTNCGAEIGEDVFSANSALWLEVVVGAETLTPRQPIRTVPFAVNSETIQGYPISASQAAEVNTLLVMDSNGWVTLAEDSPDLRSVAGNFTIEGQNLTLQTAAGSNGDINLLPDGTGGVNIGTDVSSSYLLDVAGDASVDSLNINDAFTLPTADGTNGQVMQTNGAGTVTWTDLSGLSVGNASTLDSLDSLQFLRSDTSDNYTSGTLTLDSGTILDVNGDLNIADTDINFDGASTNLNVTGNFSINSDDIFVDGTGQVGVGITNPSYDLHVAGSGKFSAPNGNAAILVGNSSGDETNVRFSIRENGQVQAGSAIYGYGPSSPQYTTTGDTNSGLYLSNSDVIGLSVGGSSALHILASGNTGIGTTTPGFKLDVAGDASVDSLNINDAFTLPTADGTNGQVMQTNGAGTVSWTDLSGLTVGNADTLDSLDSAQFLRSDTSDNYTSGTLTLDSGTTLDVNGDLSISDTNIDLDGANTNLNVTGDFSINTDDFVVNSAGQVGINSPVLSPGVAQTVRGIGGSDIVRFLASSGTSVVNVAGTGKLNTYGGLFMRNTQNLGDITLTINRATGQTGDLVKIYDESNNPFFYVKNSGNVGIGTDSPTAKLDVTGDLNVAETFSGTETNLMTGSLTNNSTSGVQSVLYLDNTAGTAVTESILSLNNNDNDTAVTTGIKFGGTGTITNLFDVNGTLIDASEFNILNNGITLGTETSGDYVESVDGGAGLTGSGTGEGSTPTLAVGDGDGITVNADSIDVDLLDSADGTGSNSSYSGFEFGGVSSDELTLLQGCADGQVLKWNDTTNVWYCDADAGAGSSGSLQASYDVGPTIAVDSGTGALTVDLTSANFDIKVGEGTDTGDFRIYDGTNNWIFIDESVPSLDLGYTGATTDIYGSTLTLTSANNTIIDSTGNIQLDSDTGSILLRDGGTTFATFNNSSTDLIINPVGGQLILADGDTLNVGGLSNVGYNSISDVGGSASFASSDNDLYVQDILEVGGTLYLGGTPLAANAQWANDNNIYHPINEYGDVADLMIGYDSATATGSATSVHLTSQGDVTLTGNLDVGGSTVLNNITYNWPSSQSSDYVLATDGSGNLSWTEATALTGGSNYWTLADGALSPKNQTADLLIGSTASESAKFAFINVDSGTPTASISGNITLNAEGVIGTTQNQKLTLGGTTTGDVEIVENLRIVGGDLYLDNANIISGVTGYTQFSQGVSVGNATTHYFNTSGDLNANSLLVGGQTVVDSARNLTNVGTTEFNGVTYTWPAAAIDGYVLSTDASGNLAWIAGGGAGAGGQWQVNDGALSPLSITSDINLGATATSSAKISFAGSLNRGKALAIFNQTEDQDIIAASAAGDTKFRVNQDGYIFGQRFSDLANSAYYLDPASTEITNPTDASLLTAGRVGIGVSGINSMFEVSDVGDLISGSSLAYFNEQGSDDIAEFAVSDTTLVTIQNSGQILSSTGDFASSVSDGSTATAFTFNSTNSLTDPNAKLLSVQNNTTELFHIDANGNVWAKGNIYSDKGFGTSMKNIGPSLSQYDLVVINTTEDNTDGVPRMSATDSAYAKNGFGVVQENCTNGSTCKVVFQGESLVNVADSTNRGDYIFSSTTMGKATSASKQFDGLIGIASSTDDTAPYQVEMTFLHQPSMEKLRVADKNRMYNDYVEAAKEYDASTETTYYDNAENIKKGLYFDTFKDQVKVDSTNTNGIIDTIKQKVGLWGGNRFSSATTDSAGNTYLDSNAVKSVYYYDRTQTGDVLNKQDSTPETLVELGTDPKWWTGVSLVSAIDSYSPAPPDNLSTTYNGGLLKVDGRYATGEEDGGILVTIKSDNEATASGNQTITFDWQTLDNFGSPAHSGNNVIATKGAATTLETGTNDINLTFTHTNYHVGDMFLIQSWYLEPETANDRGEKQQFPERVYLIGSTQAGGGNLSIIDADTNKLWARFEAGSTNQTIVGNENDVADFSAIHALNGKIYLAGNGGLRTISFIQDMGFWTSTTDIKKVANIYQRNIEQSIFNTISNKEIPSNTTYDVHAAVVPNQPPGVVTTSGWGYININGAAAVSEVVNLPYSFDELPEIHITSSGGSSSMPMHLDDCDTAYYNDHTQVDVLGVRFNNFDAQVDTTNAIGNAYYCYRWTATGHVSPKQYVAVGGSSGASVINEYNGNIYDYWYSLGDWDEIKKIFLTTKGEMYQVLKNQNNDDWRFGINDGIAGDQEDQTGSSFYDSLYYYGTTPATNISHSGIDMSSLYVTENTSNLNPNSNTIYLGTDQGLTVIQENYDNYNTQGPNTLNMIDRGSVKYYTENYITEQLIGDARGMWPFYGTTGASIPNGTTIQDASVKYSRLTAINSTGGLSYTSGVRGTGIDFSGNGNYLCSDIDANGTCDDDNDLDYNGQVTVGAWVKADYFENVDDRILGKIGSYYLTIGANSYGCSNNEAGFMTQDGDWTAACSGALNTGEWYYIVGVSTGGFNKIYVNGVLQNIIAQGDSASISTSGGAFQINYNGRFDGTIDDVFVTHEALTDEQIKNMYEVGKRALEGSHGLDDTRNELTDTSGGGSTVYDVDLQINPLGKAFGNYAYTSLFTTYPDNGLINKIDLNSDTVVQTFEDGTDPSIPIDPSISSYTNYVSGMGVSRSGLEIAGTVGYGAMAPGYSAQGNNDSGAYYSDTIALDENITTAYGWFSEYIDPDCSSSDCSINVYASNDGGTNWVQGVLNNTNNNLSIPEKEYSFAFNQPGNSVKIRIDFSRDAALKSNVYVKKYGVTWFNAEDVAIGSTSSGGIITTSGDSVANGDYIELQHNQNTDNILATGWVYDTGSSTWLDVSQAASSNLYEIEQVDSNTIRLYNNSGSAKNLRLDVSTGTGGSSNGSVSLASMTADVDADINTNSIWINKTDESGNLIKLQHDAVDQFTVDYQGNASVSGTLAVGVMNSAEAGTCDTTSEGQMYYDKDQKSYFYCNGTSWSAMGSGSSSEVNGEVASGNLIKNYPDIIQATGERPEWWNESGSGSISEEYASDESIPAKHPRVLKFNTSSSGGGSDYLYQNFMHSYEGILEHSVTKLSAGAWVYTPTPGTVTLELYDVGAGTSMGTATTTATNTWTYLKVEGKTIGTSSTDYRIYHSANSATTYVAMPQLNTGDKIQTWSQRVTRDVWFDNEVKIVDNPAGPLTNDNVDVTTVTSRQTMGVFVSMYMEDDNETGVQYLRPNHTAWVNWVLRNETNSGGGTSTLTGYLPTDQNQIIEYTQTNSPVSAGVWVTGYREWSYGVSSDSGADLAELYASEETLSPGQVVVFDPEKSAHVKSADHPYQEQLAGIISTQPGEVLQSYTDHQASPTAKYYPLALSGRVPVNVAPDSDPIQAGDYLTSSEIPGYATKAIYPGNVLGKALESWDPQSGQTQVLVFVDTHYRAIADYDQIIGFYNPDQNDSSASASVSGQLNFKLAPAQIWNKVKNIFATMTNKVGIFNYLFSEESYTEQLHTDLISPISENGDLTIKLGADQTATDSSEITDFATLNINNNQDQTVLSINSQGDVETLGDLVATNASLSGELSVATISAQNASISGELIATSSRLEKLETKLAELDQIKAQTADIVNATISGTLFADNINDFEQKVANALKQPSLLDQLLGTNNNQEETLPENITEYANQETTIVTQQKLADLNLTEDDIIIESAAEFIDKYFEVNGSGYIHQSLGIGQSLTVGQQIIVGDGMNISQGVIDYQPTTPDQDQTLYIQPSGLGQISLMNGLLILDETGEATVNGDFTVNGNIRTNQTLFTNLIKPNDFTNPLQVQLAEEDQLNLGEVKESSFEIVNHLGTPVATISASGEASFASLAIEQENVLGTATDSATLETSKTSGTATVPSYQAEVTLKSQFITADSLIYVTPLSSTNNQVLYVKSQQADNPETTEVNEAQVTIGFDQALDKEVKFNWWIVK